MKKLLLILSLLFFSSSVLAGKCTRGDCVNGFGTYVFDDGSKYVGENKNNKEHGQGTYTYGPGKWEGTKYVGEYKNGKRDGQGTYTYGLGEWEGDKYVGEYKNDERDGQGTYTFADGDTYVGEFKGGVSNGQGTYTYANGRIDKGIWKNGDLITRNNKISEEKTIEKKPIEEKLTIKPFSKPKF